MRTYRVTIHSIDEETVVGRKWAKVGYEPVFAQSYKGDVIDPLNAIRMNDGGLQLKEKYDYIEEETTRVIEKKLYEQTVTNINIADVIQAVIDANILSTPIAEDSR